MKLSNPRYKRQGLHVDAAVFTIIDKKVKVLLVKRANKPYIGQWMLPGGAVYNNESIDFAAHRELEEKVGIKNIYLEQVYTFGNPRRDPRLRMASVAHLALVDKNKITVLKISSKILDSQWFEINKVPKLLFDHNQILNKCLGKLRARMLSSNIAVNILPKYFTFPELHQLYETVLGEELDRRNFRKKVLSLGLIVRTGKQQENGHRPADLYSFKHKKVQDVKII